VPKVCEHMHNKNVWPREEAVMTIGVVVDA